MKGQILVNWKDVLESKREMGGWTVYLDLEKDFNKMPPN